MYVCQCVCTSLFFVPTHFIPPFFIPSLIRIGVALEVDFVFCVPFQRIEAVVRCLFPLQRIYARNISLFSSKKSPSSRSCSLSRKEYSSPLKNICHPQRILFLPKNIRPPKNSSSLKKVDPCCSFVVGSSSCYLRS